ncbi:hypothetical protein Psuf_066030 [Phytohabitans suffuscus]|uniref:Tetrapyrrole methylase domain-containing protein n=1 Tax=Phytohabitans suffuscus TaxID=624315 RepID=A0A6F8YT09_9ACTN|nr:SAM-dependent methyltransferase [Phytohabitans suffuscus]BCB89290.1 hypothetical protein Psuf_066030 [Phytohabitans suffuscus]
MRKLLVIGIGVGDPDFVTIQAVNALNTVDVFFLLDKGPAAGDLTQARQAICERFITNDRYRSVTVTDPPRDRGAADYPKRSGSGETDVPSASNRSSTPSSASTASAGSWSGATRPSTTASSG